MFSRVLESTTELGRKNRMALKSLQRWRGKGKDTRQVRTEMSLFIEIRTKDDFVIEKTFIELILNGL